MTECCVTFRIRFGDEQSAERVQISSETGERLRLQLTNVVANRAPLEFYPHVSVVSIHDLYYRDGGALMFDNTNPVYVDGGHLTEYGAMIAQPRLEKAIMDVFNN